MSLWDGMIILVLAFAIFQGYHRGFLLRMTGWIGGLSALFIASPLARWLDSPISKTVNGEAIIAKWLQEKFAKEHHIGDFINSKTMFKWMENSENLRSYKGALVNQVEASGKDLLDNMTNALSHTIAMPLWHLLVTLVIWVGVMVVFVVLGRFLSLILHKVPFLGVIDAFIGALISLVGIFVVLIAVNTLAFYFLNDQTAVGASLHHSFFAPFFKNIFELFIK